MSNPGEADLTPITSTRQLAEWFAAGSKPRDAWRIGTEHEKFGFRRDGPGRARYGTAASARCWKGCRRRAGRRSWTAARRHRPQAGRRSVSL
jgi:glutamate--cysteine ligase